MHDLPKSSETQPVYVVVLELHILTFVLYVVPVGQDVDPLPLLEPVQTPVVEQLVHVNFVPPLLPANRSEQGLHDVSFAFEV